MSGRQVLSRTVTITTLLATAAACSTDRALAPTDAPSVRASANSGPGGGGGDHGIRTDTSFTTFTVRPDRGIVKTLNGGHQLVLAPNAICSLNSSYGPTQWDSPCQAQTNPVTITARTWTEPDGHPRVDFRPRLRFVPGERAVAVLYLMDKTAVNDESSRILYCADGSSSCVDESLTDPTVATQRDIRGFLFRRIKHFSGYNIASGRLGAAE